MESDSTATEKGPPVIEVARASSGTTMDDNDSEDLGASSTETNAYESNDAEPAMPPSKRPKHDYGSEQDPVQEVQSTQSSLRSFKRIPVFIVDYHNDVLEFIYRCFGTRHLPLEKNILVHFDSHPDLVIARDVAASESYNKKAMLSKLSIENWIMPTLYAGHFNRVVWLKNSWCNQIPEGTHTFKVGHKNDRIAVNCPLNYFVSDGTYCSEIELQETRNIKLQVYNADTDRLNPAEFISADDAHSFVLDIDLDFFSTADPFIDMYKRANCYAQLKEIFYFEPIDEKAMRAAGKDVDYSGIACYRERQLQAIKDIFCHLEKKRTFVGLKKPDHKLVTKDIFKKIVRLEESLKSKYKDSELDWLLIYDSGSTTDNNGLPHHISTGAELKQYFAYFKQFLQRLPVPPVLITIAHSAQDDYCPKNQVIYIEKQVMSILREVFQDRLHHQPILQYMDDEWNLMSL